MNRRKFMKAINNNLAGVMIISVIVAMGILYTYLWLTT